MCGDSDAMFDSIEEAKLGETQPQRRTQAQQQAQVENFNRLAGYISDRNLSDLEMDSIDAEVKNLFNESSGGGDGFLGGNGHWASQSVDFGDL